MQGNGPIRQLFTEPRTAGLPVDIRIFEGDAADLFGFIEEGTVDIIAFQHAVNDVLQAILCDREGIDTTHADWGYPPDLFLNMIPMVRDWIRDIPDAHEVRSHDFSPQWWLMLERT